MGYILPFQIKILTNKKVIIKKEVRTHPNNFF